MKAIGVQFEELEDDAAALEKIQGMAKSAEGEYQLQQATNQLLGFLAEDAFKLRQTMMEQSQVANTAYLEEPAEKNLNQKKHEAFFAPDPEKSKFTHKLEKSALIGD
jgi:P-type conjugative transfer protein TrbJ